jgi:hypothetical protein
MVAPAFEVKQKVLQLAVQRIMVEDHHITLSMLCRAGRFDCNRNFMRLEGQFSGVSSCGEHDLRVAGTHR